MGIDIHGLNFLRYAAKQSALGKVATMGRQGLHLSPDRLRELGFTKGFGDYCEQFLIENFGASSVESFDYSDFENATHIADLNKPINMPASFDTVIDGGTMEHVFNAPQGLRSVSQICNVGGRILHILPANNLCNHGFWQFSPELFFSLYSARNGYANTVVFLADLGQLDVWYEIKPPRDGRWDYFASSRALYSLVLTTKVRDVPDIEVQQSQYISDWADNPAQTNTYRPSRLKAILEGTPLFKPARAVYRALRDPDGLLNRNAHLSKRAISGLV